MENQEKVVSGGVLEGVSQSSGGYLLFDIIFSPYRAFLSLKDKPRWLISLILTIIAYTVFLSLTEIYKMEDLKRNLQRDTTMSAEELARRTENIQIQIDHGVTPRGIAYGAGFIAVWRSLALFGLALLLWLGAHLFAPVVSFKAVLAATSFSFLVITPELIIKTPLILSKKSFEVYLGPAALLPRAWHDSPLFNLLEQLDIFTVWMLALLIIALPIMTNISRKQAALLVGALYAAKIIQGVFLSNLIQVV